MHLRFPSRPIGVFGMFRCEYHGQGLNSPRNVFHGQSFGTNDGKRGGASMAARICVPGQHRHSTVVGAHWAYSPHYT